MKKQINHLFSNRRTIRSYNILKALLKGIFIFSLLFTLLNVVSFFVKFNSLILDLGVFISLLLPILVTLVFGIMLFTCNLRNVKVFSKLFTFLILLLSIVLSYFWGVDLPQAILMQSIAIFMAAILLNAIDIYYIFLITALSIMGLSYVQVNKIQSPIVYWKSNPLLMYDAVVIVVTLSIVALISYLSNREIERSLLRAEESEKALRKERDLLEIRVEERTSQLEKAQMEKMASLYRFADLGKLASGLIHDLVNPLAVISMSLEEVKDDEAKHIQSTVKKALRGTKKIESYVEAARKQIQHQDVTVRFNVCEEIDQVVKLFSYLARQHDITIEMSCDENLYLTNNPIKFDQCLGNLLANAIDALKSSDNNPRTIIVSAKQKEDHLVLLMEDNGSGIASENLKNVFQPFFTTKPMKGTGIGLSMTKDIIEKQFNGSIEVSSKVEKGTIFKLELRDVYHQTSEGMVSE